MAILSKQKVNRALDNGGYIKCIWGTNQVYDENNIQAGVMRNDTFYKMLKNNEIVHTGASIFHHEYRRKYND